MLVTKLQKVTDDTSDVAILKAGMTHVTKAVAVTKFMMENCSTHDKQLVPRKRVAPNENNDVQPRFHSTRKKRKTSKVSLSNPTVSEVANVTASLSSVEAQICSVCFKEDETIGASVEVQNKAISWVQCSTCSLVILYVY